MWYFTWILGVGFAGAFAILNAMWFEAHDSVNPIKPDARDKPMTATRMIRTVSFVAALTAGLALIAVSVLLRHVQETRLHAALPILLLGVASALVYGIGYRPDSRLLRMLFSPVCAWRSSPAARGCSFIILAYSPDNYAIPGRDRIPFSRVAGAPAPV